MSDEGGFFELVDEIWAGADKKRKSLKRKHGAALGDWLADIKQYGASWTGDAWEWTAVSAENHMAFVYCISDELVRWDWGTHSGGWGGWNKPHKASVLEGRLVPIGEQEHRDGKMWTTYVGVKL